MKFSQFFFFDKTDSNWAIFINLCLVLLLFIPLFLLLFFSSPYCCKVIWQYRYAFFKGWLTTVWISTLSFLLSSCLGLLAATARRSQLAIARYIAITYIELIRGTPLLVQILFFFYVIANALGIQNRYSVGILILSLFTGAYLAEIFRAGIESINQSQLESAKAIGLNRIQTYRFIVFPQAFRTILPPLSGQLASLIKDSSLLSIIGISELTYISQQVNSATYSTLESFIPLALGYLLLTLPISLWSKFLEKKYLYET